jgi:hypothetical protein
VLDFVLAASATGLIQALATDVYRYIKECVSMSDIIKVILLGTTGSSLEDRVNNQ